MAPASNHDGGSPQTAQFRGSITRHLVWLSTPRSGSFPPPRQTRFRLLVPALPGGIQTRRVPVKGFRMLRFFLPFPSYLAQGSFAFFALVVLGSTSHLSLFVRLFAHRERRRNDLTSLIIETTEASR